MAQIAPDLRVAPLTVEQVHAMLHAGILREGEPVELIDGVLVYKDRSDHGGDPMTVGKRHNLTIKLLARLDPELSSLGCHMQTQGPLSIPPHDEPEPDGVILRGEPRDYADRVPGTADALCVIEVADSSLEYDRTHKLSLYARANIPQYVIVNLREGVVEVHEGPVAEAGRFARTSVRRAGELLALQASDSKRLEIDPSRILP
jgi:Uma2 family endonuclease